MVVGVGGYYGAPRDAAGEFVPLAPARILDTRTGNGGPPARLGPASTLSLRVAGGGAVLPNRLGFAEFRFEKR